MKRLIIVFIAVLCSLGLPAMASAYDPNPLTNACYSGGGARAESPACSADGEDPLTGPDGILKRASMILAVLASIAAVIIIIVSGLRYITANGDAQKAASARNGIVGAVIGLAIIAASTSIVVFIISKL